MPRRLRTLIAWTLVAASWVPASELGRVVRFVLDEAACGGDRCCCVEDALPSDGTVRLESGCTCGAPREGVSATSPGPVVMRPDDARELLTPSRPPAFPRVEAERVPESWSRAPEPPPPRG